MTFSELVRKLQNFENRASLDSVFVLPTNTINRVPDIEDNDRAPDIDDRDRTLDMDVTVEALPDMEVNVEALPDMEVIVEALPAPTILKDRIIVLVDDGCCFFIGEGPKGRGLFACSDIPPRTLIHVSPCIPVRKGEYDEHLKHTVLEHYLFNDTRTSEAGNKLLALGYGSLFNHSSQPNVDYRINPLNQTIEFSSGLQTIPQEKELCITYGATLWFEDVESPNSSGPFSDEEERNAMANFMGRIDLDDKTSTF